MRKNPREDFRWLEEELLALNEDEETEEETETDEDLQWWEEDEECRNTGWSVGIYEDDEEFDEDAAILALTPKEKRRQDLRQRRQQKAEKVQKKKKKKEKGIGGLVFLALLELAGIFAIIWWWIQWLT